MNHVNINRPPFSPQQADANRARAYAEAWDRAKRTIFPLLVAVSMGLIAAVTISKAISNHNHMSAIYSDVMHVYALEDE